MRRIGWAILIGVVILLLIGAAVVAPLCMGSRYGYGHGGMMGPWMMGGFGITGALLGLLFTVLILGGLAWLVVVLVRGSGTAGSSPSGEAPLDIIKRRYASGEITKDQYDALRRDLGK